MELAGYTQGHVLFGAASLLGDCLRFLSQALELACHYVGIGPLHEAYCEQGGSDAAHWASCGLSLPPESRIVRHRPCGSFATVQCGHLK